MNRSLTKRSYGAPKPLLVCYPPKTDATYEYLTMEVIKEYDQVCWAFKTTKAIEIEDMFKVNISSRLLMNTIITGLFDYEINKCFAAFGYRVNFSTRVSSYRTANPRFMVRALFERKSRSQGDRITIGKGVVLFSVTTYPDTLMKEFAMTHDHGPYMFTEMVCADRRMTRAAKDLNIDIIHPGIAGARYTVFLNEQLILKAGMIVSFPIEEIIKVLLDIKNSYIILGKTGQCMNRIQFLDGSKSVELTEPRAVLHQGTILLNVY